MLTPYEIEQRIAQQARKAQAATPLHAAAEAALEHQDDDQDQAEAARRRVQHEADPDMPDEPEVVHADLDKVYRQGAVSIPEGYPPFSRVHPEAFRRGPLTGGEAAYSPGYGTPAQPAPVPPATMSASAIARPLLTDGRPRPCAPGGSSC